MKKIFLTFTLSIACLLVVSQNINEDSCKKNVTKSEKDNISSTNINIIDNSFNQNIPINSKQRTKKKLKINQSFYKELEKSNYSPKEVYFRVIAEELESVYQEMLT